MQKRDLAKEIKDEIEELRKRQYILCERMKNQHLSFNELCKEQSEINKFEKELFKKVDKLSKE